MQRINLQHIRKSQGITQMQLAEMTGYPQGFISQIENGKVGAPEGFVRKLREIFRLSLAEIYSQQPMGESNEDVSDASSAEVCEIVRRFMNMLERRDEKIERLEAEIERLNCLLQSLSSQMADLKNT